MNVLTSKAFPVNGSSSIATYYFCTTIAVAVEKRRKFVGGGERMIISLVMIAHPYSTTTREHSAARVSAP